MSTAITSAPCRANVVAWARPCPRAAPVTSATLPCRSPTDLVIVSLLFVRLLHAARRGSSAPRPGQARLDDLSFEPSGPDVWEVEFVSHPIALGAQVSDVFAGWQGGQRHPSDDRDPEPRQLEGFDRVV